MFIIVDSSKFDELIAAEESTFIGAVVVVCSSFIFVLVLVFIFVLTFVFVLVFELMFVLVLVFVLLPYTVLSLDRLLDEFVSLFDKFISILLADATVFIRIINMKRIMIATDFLKILFIIIITSNFISYVHCICINYFIVFCIYCQ